MDRNRWLRLNPLLDELLDLAPEPRAARLAALREEDPLLGEDLAALLDRMEAVEREGFLELPVSLAEPSMAGRTVGAYTVERQLGQGGMGTVWLAHRTDGRYEGSVAIKFLHGGSTVPGSADRFAREGSILARLAHPHIARLVDAGVTGDGGQRYLVLEYIDGVPIDRYCDEHALGVAARVRLFLDVLAAVAHAHNRLILHRDIKPANILVTAAGEVKLLDFGIAKLMDDATVPAAATELTRAAGGAFTPAYAAPEQVEGGDVTTATDVYALGVLLYVLLSGIHPTSASTSSKLEQMRSVVETEPKKLSEAVAQKAAPASTALSRELRGDLDTIVAKALKKAPTERYANAQQLADDLRRYLNDEPIAARPDAAAYRLAKFMRRHRVGVVAGSLVVAAIGVGAGVAVWQAHEARQQRVQAEGLIEFMLGDLRKKLEPVGRLDVLDAVGERALAYYATQELGGLDADSLGRRARALHLIGEITERRGNLEEAHRVFQRAADSTAELMERFPKDGQRIFDHAQSVYWTGYVAWRRGQADAAEAAFRRYLELARQLTELDASNLDWRVEKAYAGQNLGVAYLDGGRSQLALRAFVDTREIWVGLISARPELNLELAKTLGWIAKAHEASGEYSAAIEDQQAKMDALHSVPGAEKNQSVHRLLANATHETSRLQFIQGKYGPAAQAARVALELFESLFALDTANMDWLGQMTFARTNLAEIQLALGDRGSARASIDRVAADALRLTSANAARRDWNVALRGRLLLLRSELASSEVQPSLISEFESYLADAANFESSGKALDADQAHIVATAELTLGDLWARRAQFTTAHSHWRTATDRSSKPAANGDPAAMTLLAHARLRLGDTQAARSLAQRVEASSYRHPAYADLRQRLEHAVGAATVQ